MATEEYYAGLKIIKGESSPISSLLIHTDKTTVKQRAEMLLPGNTKVFLQKYLEEVKKTQLWESLESLHKSTKEGDKREGALALNLMSIVDKYLNPRAITPFQVINGAYLGAIMKGSRGKMTLFQEGVVASNQIIQDAEKTASEMILPLAYQTKGMVLVMDNCDYSQGNKYYCKDHKPTFINTVNMAELEKTVPASAVIWKPASNPARPVDTWVNEFINKNLDELKQIINPGYEFIDDQVERGRRPGRPEALTRGIAHIYVHEPIANGDLKELGVVGDQGYQKSLGKAENVQRILKHLRTIYLDNHLLDILIIVGDEQTFETLVKIHGMANNQYVFFLFFVISDASDASDGCPTPISDAAQAI